MTLKAIAQPGARILRAALARRGGALAQILAQWPAIVGPDLAAATRVERLSAAGVLTLTVEGAAALDLQHEAPRLIERINTFLGKTQVTSLRFQRGQIARVPPRPHLRRLSAGEEQALARTVAPVGENPLGEALARLGRALKARVHTES